MDLPERAFKLTLKWLEMTDRARNLPPADFAEKFVEAHQNILRVLSDHEPPESFDASSFL
ncbi:MAG: hypothetical protein LBJ10_10010 [Clostridiales bacterium]|jgi:hypothetical protein|nr:hypothetical protein [Clostridiales bacterium]